MLEVLKAKDARGWAGPEPSLGLRGLRGSEGSGMRDSHYTQRTCHMLFLLVKAPRTIRELCDLTGIGVQSCGDWLASLEAEGLVSSVKVPRHDGKAGARSRRWTWEGA